MSNTNQATNRRRGILLGLAGAGILCVGLLCLAGAILIGLGVIGDGATAPATSVPQPTSTPPPTTAPPTPTATPTPTARPATSTPAVTTPSPVAPTRTSAPAVAPTSTTAALPPTAPPATVLPPTAPPSSGVVSTFLSDARQTKDDLLEVKIWFDRLAGGESVPCSTILAHSIHPPSSAAPAQVSDLIPTWNEYQTSIADGQQCLQWLIDFCNAGGGTIDTGTFWDRRTLSADALSHCEHVVQDLESR